MRLCAIVALTMIRLPFLLFYLLLIVIILMYLVSSADMFLPGEPVVKINRNPFLTTLPSEKNVIIAWSPDTETDFPVISPQYTPRDSFLSSVIFK